MYCPPPPPPPPPPQLADYAFKHVNAAYFKSKGRNGLRVNGECTSSSAEGYNRESSSSTGNKDGWRMLSRNSNKYYITFTRKILIIHYLHQRITCTIVTLWYSAKFSRDKIFALWGNKGPRILDSQAHSRSSG